VLGAQFRAQDLERVAIEGHSDGFGIHGSRVLMHPLDHRTVSQVHAVELADRHHAGPEVGGHLGRIAEDDHACSAVGGWARSHHRPNTGSTRGMKTYPIPKYDHTLSCPNSEGTSRLRAPTMITPVSSNTIAIHATVYQPRRCARISAGVATMYTTAAVADSEYASGASSNRRTICTKLRPVAPSAITA